MPRSVGPIVDVLALFAIVAVAQTVVGVVGSATGPFALSPPVADDPWTIATSVYAHGGLGHLLSNSIALVLFGWPVARATTRLRFHVFFLLTGATAGIAQVWVMGILGAAAPVLGASGAIFALLGYLLASNPVAEGVAASVDVPRWVVLGFFAVVAAGVTVATMSPRAALVAHFTGLMLGLVAGRARVLQTPAAHPERRLVT